MISEEEFRELQEELDDLTESLGRLEEMNEALSEVVFALLQSTSRGCAEFCVTGVRVTAAAGGLRS
ncbi:hypothetical protein HKT45_34040 [Pseudomonas aeruginosa]|nr:hypothetical protein [Pseudomonas aeruginosa]MBF3216290.1 hypothetical protein [Pseudomonas aeruginosa]